MNKRDIFLPSLTGLFIFGFIWFFACSHSASRRQLSQEELSAESLEGLEAETAANSPLAEDTELVKEEESFKSQVVQALKESAPSEESSSVKAMSEPQTEKAPEVIPAPSQMKRAVPEIASSPKVSGRFNLNRFYFVRRGDTPENFADKVYQDSGFSKSLKKWNPGKWSPGKLVYYQSPKNPSDSRVQSFYQESGLSTYEYRIKSGESLSRVAKRELGHFQSWKELAVINGVKDVDQVGVGTVLAIYSLSNERPVPVAQAPKPIPMPAPVAEAPKPAPVPAPVAAPAPVAQAPVQMPAQAPAPVAAPAPRPMPAPRAQARIPSSPVKESWTQKIFSFFETVWEETTEFIESTTKKFSAQAESKKR